MQSYKNINSANTNIGHAIAQKEMIYYLTNSNFLKERGYNIITLDAEKTLSSGWTSDVFTILKKNDRTYSLVVEVQNPFNYVYNIKYDTREEAESIITYLFDNELIDGGRKRSLEGLLKSRGRKSKGNIHFWLDSERGYTDKEINKMEIFGQVVNEVPELVRKISLWDECTDLLGFLVPDDTKEKYFMRDVKEAKLEKKVNFWYTVPYRKILEIKKCNLVSGRNKHKGIKVLHPLRIPNEWKEEEKTPIEYKKYNYV